MREKVIVHLRATFSAYSDLIESLPEEAFSKKLSIRSNTLGGQFWCIIGARESYTKALKEGHWTGFNCSLSYKDRGNKSDVAKALDQATQEFERTIVAFEWTDDREDVLLSLLEHESQHQGQLIRYIYGIGYKFPKSWVDRWALDE